ncbi:rCG48907 [Rattus norvegicus]|uniref:RCG48907 n=1 Tax=Rattus norvegicus TaxID=10116 RepID=A6IGL5_RAT|nr:rCG48907 [Rattus norvegicus]
MELIFRPREFELEVLAFVLKPYYLCLLKYRSWCQRDGSVGNVFLAQS